MENTRLVVDMDNTVGCSPYNDDACDTYICIVELAGQA